MSYASQCADRSNPGRDDLATQGFLHSFQQLQVILLQDLAIMRQEFPTHPLCDNLMISYYSDGTTIKRLWKMSSSLDIEKLLIRKTLPGQA
jgi:hypothetical protein